MGIQRIRQADDLIRRIDEAGGLPRTINWWGAFVVGLAGTILVTGIAPVMVTQLGAASVPVIWLDTPVEVLLARCMTMTGRPLFRDENSFRALYAQRLPSYQLAEHRVDSSGELGRVVAEILSRGIVSAGGREAHLVVEKPQP